jgi:hypothetical protein
MRHIEDLSNVELAYAVAKCIDACCSADECHGCPCEDISGCAYGLKIEVMKRLTSGVQNAEQDH